MTELSVGIPVQTNEPSIEVDAGLAVGSHRFSLQVVDSNGNLSKPTEAVVRVQPIRVEPIRPPLRPGPGEPVVPTPIIRRNQ